MFLLDIISITPKEDSLKLGQELEITLGSDFQRALYFQAQRIAVQMAMSVKMLLDLAELFHPAIKLDSILRNESATAKRGLQLQGSRRAYRPRTEPRTSSMKSTPSSASWETVGSHERQILQRNAEKDPDTPTPPSPWLPHLPPVSPCPVRGPAEGACAEARNSSMPSSFSFCAPHSLKTFLGL